MDQKETSGSGAFVNDLLYRFDTLAKVYIFDKLDELSRTVEDLQIIDEYEYEVVMKTIERIEDRVKKALIEINEILITWCTYKVLNRKYRFEPRHDIIDKLENIFKWEYESFVRDISFKFAEKFQYCDTYNREVVSIVNHEQLFDDFINKDVEEITQNFIKALRMITGVDEVEKPMVKN